MAAARYLAPLREGGSLPALMEGDDGRLYVAKFRGAGQGTRALIAEIIGGELARALGLRIPEIVRWQLPAEIGRTEPDAEIRELLLGSVGTNVALAQVPAALGFDVATHPAVPGALASAIVALDAFVMNVDRTARNPNLLWADGKLWLIDHGAALYFHHDWTGDVAGSDRPFVLIRDHVLLPWADALPAAGAELQARFDDGLIDRVVGLIPDDFFVADDALPTPAAARAAYAGYLRARRAATPTFIEEAVRARARRV